MDARLLWRLCAVAAVACVLPAHAGSPALRHVSVPTPAATERLSSLPLAAQGLVSRTIGRDNPTYQAQSGASGLRLQNRPQGLVARFTSSGVAVGRVGLELRTWGHGRTLLPVSAATPSAAANRVVYRRGDLSEWYANGPLGIEQGFKLQRAPGRIGPLTLSLALSGLRAQLAPTGEGLAFAGSPLRYRGLAAVDARGRKLQAWLELHGPILLIRVNDAGARYPLTIDPLFQAARLTASDGAANDTLGAAVAVSGDTVVVGAPDAAVGANSYQGAAYVFVRPATSWADATETAKLTSSAGAAADVFGFSVAISSGTIVVGAPGVDSGQGAAYVFVKPLLGWSSGTETAELTASDGAHNVPFADGFGYSVGVSGNTVVVGAPRHNDLGAAYVFVKPLGSWVSANEDAELSAIASDGGQFAQSVAIAGDTVVAGSFGGNSGKGGAYVFVKPLLGWSSTSTTDAQLTASNGFVSDNFGGSGVAISTDGTTVVAGANQAPYNPAKGPGEAYVFVEPLTGWAGAGALNETGELSASDAVNGAEFGGSVAVNEDGSTVLVGARNAGTHGKAYLFNRPLTGWATATEDEQLTAAGSSLFGWAVAIDPSTAVVGARDSMIGTNAGQGAAYVFIQDLTPPTSTIDFPGAATYSGGSWAPDPCPYIPGGFCGTAQDEAGGSGLDHVEWSLRQGSGDYWDGSGFTSATPVFLGTLGSSSWSVPFPVTSFPVDGTYTLHVRAVDRAGNVETDPSVTFTIDRTSSLLYTGDQLVILPNSFTPAARLTCDAGIHMNGKQIDFSLDRNPFTGAVGSYFLESGFTTPLGVATGAAISTAGWQEGVYEITAVWAGGDGYCDAASDIATLTVGSTGDAATGGGWYTLSGFGKINFGFEINKQKDGTYKGQFVLISRGKAWRLKGTLSSYVKTSTGSGAAGGSGKLSYQDVLGNWTPTAVNPTSATISFVDGEKTGGGKKSGDTFGIKIVHTVVSPPEPALLPNSSPTPLKGGDIAIH